MPQEFLAVRCAAPECGAFSSQLAKKSATFACPLCGERQAVQRVFARSSKGADIRRVVGAYNAARGAAAAEAAEDEWRRAEAGGAEAPAAAAPASAGKWRAWAPEAEEEEAGWTIPVPGDAAAARRPAPAERPQKRRRGGREGAADEERFERREPEAPAPRWEAPAAPRPEAAAPPQPAPQRQQQQHPPPQPPPPPVDAAPGPRWGAFAGGGDEW